jgi:hypothetical protein
MMSRQDVVAAQQGQPVQAVRRCMALCGLVVQDEVKGNQKGHALEKLTAKKKRLLRCTICSGDRFMSSCPQLHGPKPAATFCGLARDGLWLLLDSVRWNNSGFA